MQHSIREIKIVPATPALPQTFNVLQFNANGSGNKLTEIGVVLERNKVKVAVIQESKLSSKSKNPCIRNYTTVRKDRPHGHGGGLLVFIHESITFSKQPSSPEALSDPHLEELTRWGYFYMSLAPNGYRSHTCFTSDQQIVDLYMDMMFYFLRNLTY